jgi:glycosyltransferase involved in cell wall biosynthesis
MRGSIDIVIPARGEHGQIASCLTELLKAAENANIRVVVVANGASAESTADLVRRNVDSFVELGSELYILQRLKPGKAGALNLGDRLRRGGAVVYLDADVALPPESLHAIIDALSHEGARLVAPRLAVCDSPSRITREFARIWLELPAVAGDVIGAGCFAVNAAGRARWGRFPELIADDAFVRSRFLPTERMVLNEVTFQIALPGWPELPRSVRRWRDGNRQLSALPSAFAHHGNSDPRGGFRTNVAWLASRPDLWSSVPFFLTVWLASSFGGPSALNSSWQPVRP